MSAGEAKSAAAPARAVHDDIETMKEGEICAICLEALPRFGHGAVRFTCCGKSIHTECAAQFSNSGCDKNCPMAELRSHPMSSSTRGLFVGRERERRGPWSLLPVTFIMAVVFPRQR